MVTFAGELGRNFFREYKVGPANLNALRAVALLSLVVTAPLEIASIAVNRHDPVIDYTTVASLGANALLGFHQLTKAYSYTRENWDYTKRFGDN